LDYCGKDTSYYLISPITYNTPVPNELALELEYSASDSIVVKHANGTNTFINGAINKKALYSYVEDYNKLV
jgi:hypothetical protein